MSKIKTFVKKHEAVMSVTMLIVGTSVFTACINYAATSKALDSMRIDSFDINKNNGKIRIIFKDGSYEIWTPPQSNSAEV